MNLEDLKIKEGEQIINSGLNISDISEMFIYLLGKNEYNEDTINGILESLKIEGENIVSPFKNLMYYVNFQYPIFPQIEGVPLRGAEESAGMQVATSLDMGAAASVGMGAARAGWNLENEGAAAVGMRQVVLVPAGGCIYPEILEYDGIDEGIQAQINTDYTQSKKNIYNMVTNSGFYDYTFQKCISEHLCHYPQGYPQLESPLRNKKQNGTIMQACYLNSLLHFLYPVLLNIQYTTNIDEQNEVFRMSDFPEDYNNIVKFIIDTLQKKRSNSKNYVKKEDEDVYTTIRRFIQFEIQYFERNRFQLMQKTNEFSIGDACDAGEAYNRISNNLSLLGYCTKNSFTGLVYAIFDSSGGVRYQTEHLQIDIQDNHYNLEQKINEVLFVEDIDNYGNVSKKTLINVGEWMPLFLIISVKSYEEIKPRPRVGPFFRKAVKFPINLDNVIIRNVKYEITDIVYYDLVHYVSYNKRNFNERIGWYYFDDQNYPNVPQVEMPPLEGRFYPQMYLLKKV